MNTNTTMNLDAITTDLETAGATITTIGMVAAVRWEPCPEFHTDDTEDADQGVCRRCGWSSDEHELATAA
jgi:hypothetical protein